MFVLRPLSYLFVLLGFLSSCVSLSSQKVDSDLFFKIQLMVRGVEREAFFFDPRADKNQRRPMLIVFHGAGGTALGAERLSGLQRLAKEKNFLLLYPQGLKKVWNDGRNAKAIGHADLEFFDELVEHMKHHYMADEKRVYVAGMSNGGLFAFRIACERAHIIKGMASVAGLLGEDLSKKCHPTKPVSVLVLAGTEDSLMPFEGGNVTGPFGVKKLGRVLSFQKTLSFWSKKLECKKSTSTQKNLKPKDPTHTESYRFSGCVAAKEVYGLSFVGAGHTWPGGWQYLRESLVGKTSHEASASEKIVSFFHL